MTECSFAASADSFGTWTTRAARTALPLFIPGNVAYVQKPGHEAPGIYS
jgi:hypothetical protein